MGNFAENLNLGNRVRPPCLLLYKHCALVRPVIVLTQNFIIHNASVQHAVTPHTYYLHDKNNIGLFTLLQQ